MGNYDDPDFGPSSSPRRTRSEAQLMRLRMENAMKRVETPEAPRNVDREVPDHVRGPQHIIPDAPMPKASDDPVLMGVLNNLQKMIETLSQKKAFDADDKDLLDYLQTPEVERTIQVNDPNLSAELGRIFVKHSDEVDESHVDIPETQGGSIADALNKLKDLDQENTNEKTS